MSEALERLHAWPRLDLGSFPTRLVAAPRLRAALGPDAPEILVKMDAETGFALGGNKVRKLAFELAPQRLDGVTHLVTSGGSQSNHCRVTAAAAARLGLECVLVLNGPEPDDPRGNALLHRLFGATIRTVADRAEREAESVLAAEEIERAGGRALRVPLGASTGLGSLGYAAAAVELAGQLDALPAPERTWVFVSASSCGTLAGLLLGFGLLGRDDVRFVGVSADVPAHQIRTDAERLAAEGAGLLGWGGSIRPGALAAADEFVGGGYGVPTERSEEAQALFARTEGIVLDPVYTAKAAAGMVDWVRRGSVPRSDRIVFVHTGGHPALLA